MGKKFSEHEKAKYWNYELNGDVNPKNVALNSKTKYWFKCDKCLHNFDASLCNINKNRWCPYCAIPCKKLCNNINCDFCYNNSFASHDKAIFWHLNKNNGYPRNHIKGSGIRIWFKCNICNHDFDATLNHVASKDEPRWCPYCAKPCRKLCDSKNCNFCYNNSFASHDKSIFWHLTKNGDDNPRNFMVSSANNMWFNCNICGHDFNMLLNSINNGGWCPYCAHQKLCNIKNCIFCYNNSFANHKKSIFWHSVKNKNIKPRDVFIESGKKYWFICENNHEFFSSPNNINKYRWCPTCKYKTERKLYDFLKPIYENLFRGGRFDWCKNPATNRYFPFDFALKDLCLIIEIDGRQHFIQRSNWESPQLITTRDVYKMQQALNNGYTVIRMLQEDIWYEKIDWKNKLLEAIEIHKEIQMPGIMYICSNMNLYKNHKV